MKKGILIPLMSAFCILFFFSGVFSSHQQLPDLRVRFTAPGSAFAGDDIGNQIKLEVANFGTAVALGSKPGQEGYMVDLVLSTDTTHPPGWATYKASFQEDVLLRGGRVSITKTLDPRQIEAYPVGAGIPADTPAGTYYICARVDPGNRIAELGKAGERNNVFCKEIIIKRREDNCQRKYPHPRIRYSHKDPAGRIHIPVINFASYSNEMFREAPDLPPCGANTKSARTWVDIYDGSTHKRIYGFCAFGSRDDLRKIWFKPTKKSGKVYIILNDRACERKYRSNMVVYGVCRKRYPNPTIKYSHTDSSGRVYIPVLNWASYSNELFRKAPELPPCGANPNSARTWVDIFDAVTGNRIYGFCAFDSKDDLKKIWFKARSKRGQVYIILNDRACKKTYKSNTISWPK